MGPRCHSSCNPLVQKSSTLAAEQKLSGCLALIKLGQFVRRLAKAEPPVQTSRRDVPPPALGGTNGGGAGAGATIVLVVPAVLADAGIDGGRLSVPDILSNSCSLFGNENQVS